jgi:hypothetical protein
MPSCKCSFEDVAVQIVLIEFVCEVVTTIMNLCKMMDNMWGQELRDSN